MIKTRDFVRSISLICLMLLIGCKPEVIEITNTVKEIQVINNSQECLPTPCICSCESTTCGVTECDDTRLKQMQLQNGRLISEVNYYKNLTSTMLYNSTPYDELYENYTRCVTKNLEMNLTITNIKEQI